MTYLGLAIKCGSSKTLSTPRGMLSIRMDLAISLPKLQVCG